MRKNLLITTILPFLISCNLDPCGNDIYQRLDNKWTNRKIIKFARRCGATTGASIQISILPYDEGLPNEAGNAFISNGYIEDTVVKVTWRYRETVLITYSHNLEIFKKDSTVGGIRVYYEVE